MNWADTILAIYGAGVIASLFSLVGLIIYHFIKGPRKLRQVIFSQFYEIEIIGGFLLIGMIWPLMMLIVIGHGIHRWWKWAHFEPPSYLEKFE